MIKARMKDNFLIVSKGSNKYKCWFPNTFSLDKKFSKQLLDTDKSLLMIELMNTEFKSYNILIDDYNLMLVWNDNNKSILCRKEIIKYISNTIDI